MYNNDGDIKVGLKKRVDGGAAADEDYWIRHGRGGGKVWGVLGGCTCWNATIWNMTKVEMSHFSLVRSSVSRVV